MFMNARELVVFGALQGLLNRCQKLTSNQFVNRYP